MISVIIPVYNEEEHIKRTIQSVRAGDLQNLVAEIIVVDGGSQDATVAAAQSENVQVVVSPKKGRAAQMNWGAQLACSSVLYFLHADTIPPVGFSRDIKKRIEKGHTAGCFMLQFDYPHWFLKANCWFTRFDVNAFHYGDQSLFVRRESFESIGGFSEQHIIFEDYHILKELKKHGSFCIIKKPVVTSARKYLENGIFKMQGIFYFIYFLYKLGFSQQRLIAIYKRLIQQDKI